MRLLLLVIFLCGLQPGPAAAQYHKTALELQTDSLLAGLRAAGVDTACVYQSYCVGCRSYYAPDDTSCYNTKELFISTYLFWQKAGRYYGQQLDNCSVGRSRQLPTAMFWPYFLAHRQQIKKEAIKEFVNFNHGMVASFDFYLQQDTVSQYFKPINLVRQIRHPARKNRYYRHNTHTHTTRLYEMLNAATEAFPQKAPWLFPNTR